MKFRIGHRKILPYGGLGNPPQNVNAEFEPERMNVVSERLESGAIRGGRKARDVWRVSPEFVEREELFLARFLRGMHEVPALVNHHVLPTKRLQVLRHEVRVRAELLLVYGRAVRIPAIPAHGRSRCELPGGTRARARFARCACGRAAQ